MYQRLTLWLKNIFGFSQTEVNGVVILALLSLVLLSLPLFLRNNNFNGITESDERFLDSLVASMSVSQTEESFTEASTAVSEAGGAPPAPRLFEFDPNTLGKEQWLQLGVREEIANRILKYVEHGGHFTTKGDLKKIYGFKKEQYKKLHDYIQLPASESTVRHTVHKSQRLNASPEERPEKKKLSAKERWERSLTTINLNTAEAQDFLQFYGIGAKLSKRIVKFRTKLGGFHAKHQLFDIYGLDSSVVQQISDHSELGSTAVNQINLNTITLDSLKWHPYVSYKIARVIVNYRELHGNYTRVTDLKNIHVIDDSLYVRIEPYFTVE